MKEYQKIVRKIWNSELYSWKKAAAHNIFVILVLSPLFGISDCSKQQLENLDIKTRKILTASGRLYYYCENGGIGLNSIADTFIPGILSLSLHLKIPFCNNWFLSHVLLKIWWTTFLSNSKNEFKKEKITENWLIEL